MGYIRERAFVILLDFLGFFNSRFCSVVLDSSCAQEFNSASVEAFSTTLGFSPTTLPDRCHFKYSVVNFVLRVCDNFAFLVNLFWFLPSGLLVFCFLDARSLCFLYRAGGL
jgi:hypothetical protein